MPIHSRLAALVILRLGRSWLAYLGVRRKKINPEGVAVPSPPQYQVAGVPWVSVMLAHTVLHSDMQRREVDPVAGCPLPLSEDQVRFGRLLKSPVVVFVPQELWKINQECADGLAGVLDVPPYGVRPPTPNKSLHATCRSVFLQIGVFHGQVHELVVLCRHRASAVKADFFAPLGPRHPE